MSYNASNVYDVISALHCNDNVDPQGRHFIPGVTIVEHVCSSFSNQYDNGCNVCSSVNM